MKGVMLVRAARALIKTNGRVHEAKEISDNDQKVAAYLSKAMVSGASTIGSPLVTTDIVAREFAEYAFSLSIPGRIMANAMQLPFKSQVGSISGIGAGWVEEAKAVPVRKGKVEKSGFLNPFKVASLVVLSDELLRLATPGTDTVIRNMMVSEAVRVIDQKFLSTDQEVDSLSPAGAFLDAPSASDLAAAIDLHISNGNSLSGSALVMPFTSVLNLTNDQLRQFDLLGISFIPSEYATGLSLIDPANMIINVEGTGLMTTSEGTVEMLDDPGNNTSEPAHAEQVSLFHVNAAAIMTIIYCAWVNVGKPVTILESIS